MTTPTTTAERPERMTEEEFADAIGRNGGGWPDALVVEARRARSEEERLTRKLAALAPPPSGRPARMTEAELHELETTSPLSLYAALQRIEVLLREIRDSREEEARLERKRAAEEKFGEAIAHEVGKQIEARLELERANASLARDLDGLKREVDSLIAEQFWLIDGVCYAVGRGEAKDCRQAKPNEPDEWCPSCAANAEHAAVVAERDDARTERDELRADIVAIANERNAATAEALARQAERNDAWAARDAAREEAERLRGDLATATTARLRADELNVAAQMERNRRSDALSKIRGIATEALMEDADHADE